MYLNNEDTIMSIGGSSSTKRSDSKTTENETTSESKTGSRTEQLIIDQAGIDKITKDLLSGPGGLADIFAEENVSGLFDTSVTAQAAGNLTANIAGEIAKITGKTEILTEEDAERRRKLRRKTIETEVEAEAHFKTDLPVG